MRHKLESIIRAKTDVTEMRNGAISSMEILRDLIPTMTPAQIDALAEVETFVAIALRVLAKTNPSKVRDEARTVHISYLLKDLP